jgi:hypothetical protein
VWPGRRRLRANDRKCQRMIESRSTSVSNSPVAAAIRVAAVLLPLPVTP